jgi:hypothetical protein
MLNFKTNHVSSIKEQNIVKKYSRSVSKIIEKLESKSLPGCEMTG